MTVEAGSLNLNDWVFLGQSLYSVATIGTSGHVTFVHDCPDGTVRIEDLERHDEVETAGERLTDLRGRRDDIDRQISAATVRANRQHANATRREIDLSTRRTLRTERADIQAQIDELEDLGVAAELNLGTDPRHDDELRAEAQAI